MAGPAKADCPLAVTSRQSGPFFPLSRHDPAESGERAGNADRAVLIEFRRGPAGTRASGAQQSRCTGHGARPCIRPPGENRTDQASTRFRVLLRKRAFRGLAPARVLLRRRRSRRGRPPLTGPTGWPLHRRTRQVRRHALRPVDNQPPPLRPRLLTDKLAERLQAVPPPSHRPTRDLGERRLDLEVRAHMHLNLSFPGAPFRREQRDRDLTAAASRDVASGNPGIPSRLAMHPPSPDHRGDPARSTVREQPGSHCCHRGWPPTRGPSGPFIAAPRGAPGPPAPHPTRPYALPHPAISGRIPSSHSKAGRCLTDTSGEGRLSGGFPACPPRERDPIVLVG